MSATGLAGPVVQVLHLGLACCGIESRPGLDLLGEIPAGPTTPASILVLAGTLTPKLVPRVLAAYEAAPKPCRVVAFGACTISGGPYWDSYNVLPGIASLPGLPAAVLVPGCPPRPEDLVAALGGLVDG